MILRIKEQDAAYNKILFNVNKLCVVQCLRRIMVRLELIFDYNLLMNEKQEIYIKEFCTANKITNNVDLCIICKANSIVRSADIQVGAEFGFL